MSVIGQAAEAEIREVLPWNLAPSPSRVDEIDAKLRLRLAESFEYLGGLRSLAAGDEDNPSALVDRLKAGSVSCWVFCLYSRLVAELSNDGQGHVQSFDAIVDAASLPAAQGVIGLRDSTFADSWWDHFQLLLDTDRLSPFRPIAPTGEDVSRCKQDIEAGLELMQQLDPVWHDEVKSLLRSIVLGSPPNSDLANFFNGASTFFLWGSALLNANLRRAPIPMVDLLVHESSHVLLFGLASEGGLTLNSGKERYGSPVREDERPIEGIFHACFVTTRVHLAMRRLLDSGSLGDDDSRLANKYSQHNERAGRESLAVLESHAEVTNLGRAILASLQEYWASQPHVRP